jgi:hypothetical protein
MLEDIQPTKTIEDVTTTLEEDDEEDVALSIEEAITETEKARYVLGEDFTSINTEGERVALNQIIAEDVNNASAQGELDAQVELVAQGKLKDAREAKAMQQSLAQFRMPEEVALEETVAYKAQAEAEETGETTSSIQEAVRKEYLGGFNKADILAKEQILLRLQQEVKQKRSLGNKFLHGFANTFVPFFEVGQLEAAAPENGWFENNYQTVPAYVDKLVLSSYTPAEFEAIMYGMLSKMSPAQASLFLEAAIDRPMFMGSLGLALDVTAIATVAGKAAKGASKATTLAKTLKEAGIEISSKQTTKEAAKGALQGAAKGVAEEIPLLYGVVNTTAHPVKAWKQRGLRKKYATLLQDAARNAGADAFLDPEASKSIVQDVHKTVVEETVYSAASPRGTKESVAGIGSLREVRDENAYKEFLTNLYYEQMKRTGSLDKMTDEALEELRKETLYSFQEAHPDSMYNFEDVDFILRQNDPDPAITAIRKDSGKYTFRYRIGTGADGAKPFDTAEVAREFAEKNKIAGVSDVVCDRTGCWLQVDMVSARTPEELVSDRFIDSAKKSGIKNIKEKADGGISSWWRGQSARSTPVRRATDLAAHEKESVIYATVADGLRIIDRLNKNEAGLLETLVSKSRQEGKWIDPAWMAAQGVPAKVQQAYQTRRLLNDYDWLVENKRLQRQLTEEGYKKISVTGIDDDSKVAGGSTREIGYEKVISWEDSSVLGKEESLWYRIDGAEEPIRLTEEDIKKYKAQGYRITQSTWGYEEVPAAKIRNIYHPKKYIEEPIDAFPVHYVPGGRAFYSSDNVFIKQMDVAVADDVRYVAGVNTLTAGTSKRAMLELAESLEEARQILIKYRKGEMTVAQATKALQHSKANGLNVAGSIEDFNKWALKHRLSVDPDATIEAVEDGATLASYNKLMSDKNIQNLDEDINKFSRGSSNLYSKEQMLKKRHRSGNDLEQLDMDYAPKRMDAKEEVKKLVNNIINKTTMDAYTRYYADNFNRIYKQVLKNDVSGYKALNLQSLVERNEANKELWDSAATAIRQYETIRGIPNRFDEKIITAIDATLEPFLGVDRLRAIHKAEPLNGIREFASHLTFMFNPAQLFKQFAGSANTHLLNMGASLEADRLMMLYPVYKHIKSGDAIAKAAKILGMGEENLEGIVKLLDNVDEVVSKGRYFEGGMLRGDIQKTFVEKGYYFYVKGENGNRLHAAIASLITHGGKGADNVFRKKSVLDLPTEEYAEILNTYNKYYMNMDAIGTAPLQTSAMAQSLLQFQTYKMRFLEVWCDKELSFKQRLGFYASHLGLFGLMGFGVTNVFSGSDDNALMYTVTHGVIDSAMKQLFEGSEYIPSVSSIASASVADLAEVGTTPFGQILAETPIGRTIEKGAGLIFSIPKYTYERFVKPYTFEQYVDTMYSWWKSGKNPATGASRATRAGEALFTGRLENTKGISTATMSKADALMSLFGMDNLVSIDLYRSYDASSDNFKKIKEAAAIIAPLRAKAYAKGLEGDEYEIYKIREYELTHEFTPAEMQTYLSELDKASPSAAKSDLQKLMENDIRLQKQLDPETRLKELLQ